MVLHAALLAHVHVNISAKSLDPEVNLVRVHFFA